MYASKRFQLRFKRNGLDLPVGVTRVKISTKSCVVWCAVMRVVVTIYAQQALYKVATVICTSCQHTDCPTIGPMKIQFASCTRMYDFHSQPANRNHMPRSVFDGLTDRSCRSHHLCTPKRQDITNKLEPPLLIIKYGVFKVQRSKPSTRIEKSSAYPWESYLQPLSWARRLSAIRIQKAESTPP